MATFSIWEGEHCGIALGRGAGPPACADGTPVDPTAVPIKVFQATSWNEACRVQVDLYGWGPYVPQDGWEEIGPDEA